MLDNIATERVTSHFEQPLVPAGRVEKGGKD
jgi:hypothetical protein